MRRLPVYLLLDTSGSMYGEPIEAVRSGLNLLVNSLRQNPYALETAYLSVITFDNDAKQIVPLTELMDFQQPNIRAGGGTSMGAALKLLAKKVNTEVKRGSAEEKGDWKPLIFLLSDGGATDNLDEGIQAIKGLPYAAFIACAAGSGADVKELHRITETVVSLDTADSNTIAQFFAWVSASVSVGSQKAEQGSDMSGFGDLPPPPAEIKIDLSKH